MFFFSFYLKQNLLHNTSTLFTLSNSVKKYRHNIFPKKNTLYRNNKNKTLRVLRIKNGKGIDTSDNLYYQDLRNAVQYHSKKRKHKAGYVVGPTELNISEARPK